jgi:hypothetical protein
MTPIEELLASIREHQAELDLDFEGLRDLYPGVSEMVTEIQNKNKELVCLIIEETQKTDHHDSED